MKQVGAYLLFACIGFVGACGSAASADYEPPTAPTATADPLLTVYSQIVSVDRGVMANGMRAAFVWFPASPGAAVQVSQDLGPPLTDGLTMAINVIQAPPVFAETASRQAELVFYLDGNGNDKLDIYPLGNASPDRVVGRAPETRIVWGMGRTDTTKAEPTQKSAGRVCTKEAPDYSLVCGMDDDDPGLAPSSPIPVQFLNEEVLGAYTCAGFWGSQQWLDGDRRLSADLHRQICNRCSSSDESASGGEGACRWEPTSGGGWRACVEDPHLCGTTFCHVATGPYVPGQSDCP